MKEITQSPSFMQFMMELGSKVNHDLMGYMHVVDFCSEELSSNLDMLHETRGQNYWDKLHTSIALATDVIRYHRLVMKTLRGFEHAISLHDGISLAFALSRLMARDKACWDCQVVVSKEFKSASIHWNEVIILSLLFDFLKFSSTHSDQKNVVIFTKEDSSVPLSFCHSNTDLSESDLDKAFLPAEHVLFKYWEEKSKQIFKNKVLCARDIIGLLRAKDGKNHFYFQTGLFHINS